jgi:aminopeptidase N
VRSLIGAFIHQNLVGYHRADGAGYCFAADMILAVDKLNPQVAARLAGGFNRWRRMTPARRESLHAILQSLLAQPGLSRDVYEIVARNLDKPA